MWNMFPFGLESSSASETVSVLGATNVAFADERIREENNVIYQKKVAFWMYCADYCIHIRELPPKVEVEFLSAMTFGANGLSSRVTHFSN